MAKKSNKASTQSNNSIVVVILIVIILGGGIYLGWKKGGNRSETIQEHAAESTKSAPPSAGATKPAKNTSEKKKTESNTSETKAIDTYDGKKEEVATNKKLPEYTEENKYYFSSSFDFAWPAYTSSDMIIEHDHFTLKYNEKTEQADWVAYVLTRNNLNNAQFERKDNFRIDPNISTGSATLDDYKGSGYDRGHLAPAADFTWTKEGLDDSFYMSNMSPQEPSFNRGIWKSLEERVRDMAKSNGKVYVVTGPIFQGITAKKIGSNKVAVPDKYYKVILELEGSDVKGIGFVLDNAKSSTNLSTYAVSIDEVEKITKLDFFPSIPDDLENRIEASYNYSAW